MNLKFLIVTLALLSTSAYSQANVAYTFNGDSVSDRLGFSVCAAGDVNGDGFDDLIVGAPFDSNGIGFGSAWVFSGFDGSTLYTFFGDSVDDRFGESVSGAGDVNGDGFADLIVGAWLDDNNGISSGSARVFSGFDGSTLYTFNGDSANDFFGLSVSGAGDVNGDGFDDMIVGARGDDNNGFSSGSARVFSGFDGSTLYTFNGDSADDNLGFSVSGAGDVNGDGFADLIVGVPNDDNTFTNAGSARVFSGFDGSTLYTFDGDGGEDRFGRSVSGAGDVNGDGFADLIIGAPFNDNNGNSAGRARIFSGSDGSTLYIFDGDGADDRFGGSVSGAGDVNGDGFADVIVGANGDDNNGSSSGSARVLSGFDGSTLYTFDGDSVDDKFGGSVSGAGDVNGDGLDDLIVGADGDDNNGIDSGSARVFLATHQGLGSCATGGVGANAGGPFDVLQVAGSAGLPSRRVNVGIGQPISIGMIQPPTNPFPASFSVFGLIGEPAFGDNVVLPFNVGSMCFLPAPLDPMFPGVFVLTTNIPPNDPFGYVGLVGSNPTPWTFVRSAGLPFPFVMTFQGIIFETPGSLKVTNAVILDVN